MPAVRDGTSGRGSRIPRWLLVSAAAMLVTSPLPGVGFQGDQRTWMFIVMNETGGDPWEVVARTVRNIDYFLSAGNFRPLGRMLTDLEHVFYMETALATGVPPHLVHGFTRPAMVALLAVMAIIASCRLWNDPPHSEIQDQTNHLPTEGPASPVSLTRFDGHSKTWGLPQGRSVQNMPKTRAPYPAEFRKG